MFGHLEQIKELEAMQKGEGHFTGRLAPNWCEMGLPDREPKAGFMCACKSHGLPRQLR